jgi:hypothetical protein
MYRVLLDRAIAAAGRAEIEPTLRATLGDVAGVQNP